MEKIGSYSAYSNSIYQQNKTAKNAGNTEKTDAKEFNAASKTGEKVTLSAEAKNLLKELILLVTLIRQKLKLEEQIY